MSTTKYFAFQHDVTFSSLDDVKHHRLLGFCFTCYLVNSWGEFQADLLGSTPAFQHDKMFSFVLTVCLCPQLPRFRSMVPSVSVFRNNFFKTDNV